MDRHASGLRTEIAKKGKVVPLPLFWLAKISSKDLTWFLPLLSSPLASHRPYRLPERHPSLAPRLISPAGGAGSAGAAGAGGGGGGAGSSFLPQPTTVKVRANNAIADNETNLFRISLVHLLSRHTSLDLLALVNFYYICGAEFQVICGHIVVGTGVPRQEF